MKIIVYLITTLIFCLPANSQYFKHQQVQHILKKNFESHKVVFGTWTADGHKTETHLWYLGDIMTNKGKTFKLINSVVYWGLSKRATPRILIFNESNQYVGNYYLHGVNDLPTKLQKGKLYFYNNDNDCDKNLVTIIDLKKGFPKTILRRCKNENVDFITFD